MERIGFKKALMEALASEVNVIEEAVSVEVFDNILPKKTINEIGKRLSKIRVKFDNLKFEKLEFGSYKYDGRVKEFTKLPTKYNRKSCIAVLAQKDKDGDVTYYLLEKESWGNVNIIGHDGKRNVYDFDRTELARDIKKEKFSLYVALIRDEQDRIDYEYETNSASDKKSETIRMMSFRNQIEKLSDKYDISINGGFRGQGGYVYDVFVYLKDSVFLDNIHLHTTTPYKMGDDFIIDVSLKRNVATKYNGNSVEEIQNHLENVAKEIETIQSLIKDIKKIVKGK